MGLIAEIMTPSHVLAQYHRVDLSDVRLADGKAHVRLYSYKDKAARLDGAEHLARSAFSVPFDLSAPVSVADQIYAGVKNALNASTADDLDAIGVTLLARQSNSVEILQAKMRLNAMANAAS